MAFNDAISQFSQDIPASQPERDSSRTPRRHSHVPEPMMHPGFRGPIHRATSFVHQPWTPPFRPSQGCIPSPPNPPQFGIPPPSNVYGNPHLRGPMIPQCFPPPPPLFDQVSPIRTHTTTPKSPGTPARPQHSLINRGYTLRPIEIPAVADWSPDVEYHDTTKVNGLDLPMTVRTSRFTDIKDIGGMDPLQVPLWKFLYQGLHKNWLRKLAHGREIYVLPFDNIGTTVFIAELLNQLKTRNIDLDRLAAHRSRQAGTNLQTKEATQQMARDVAQHIQSWLPTYSTADASSQQKILELEAEIAKMKSDRAGSTPSGPGASGSTPGPLERAFHGQSQAAPVFDPSSLTLMPTSPSPLLETHPLTDITEKAYKKWIQELDLPKPQSDTVERNIGKALDWWKKQPAKTSACIERVCVGMGMDVKKIGSRTSHELLIRILTVVLTCAS